MVKNSDCFFYEILRTFCFLTRRTTEIGLSLFSYLVPTLVLGGVVRFKFGSDQTREVVSSILQRSIQGDGPFHQKTQKNSHVVG